MHELTTSNLKKPYGQKTIKKSELNQKEKVKNIVMPNNKIERNYLANLTLSDARIWFRYRSQILENIKGNRSSQWENTADTAPQVSERHKTK